jgi:hypothetical protein
MSAGVTPLLLPDEEPVCNYGSTVRPGDRVGVVSQLGREVPIIDHDSGESDRRTRANSSDWKRCYLDHTFHIPASS